MNVSDSCGILDIAWYTQMNRTVFGQEIYDVESNGSISNCREACLAQKEAPVCDGFDYNSTTQNCSLFTGDDFSGSTQLVHNTDSEHQEWLCVNSE